MWGACLATGRSQTYTYDEMNRLATAQSQAASGPDCWGLQYGYDRYANLLSASVTKCSAPALSLSVDTSTNQITNTGFAYDAAGNLTADGFATFNWNAEGRMASTAGVNYDYDGDGKRVKKSNGKLYWYGLRGEVLAESDLNGTVISEYIYFNGTRIARRDVASGNVYYFLGDRLGNARVVTNSTGSVVEESDFYPFGQERIVTDSLDNNYKFTGHERDTESGLDHTLYRQLSSQQGRWLSPDPVRGSLANPQSWNRYAYVENNPCNARDPMGAAIGGIENDDPFSMIIIDMWFGPEGELLYAYGPRPPVGRPFIPPGSSYWQEVTGHRNQLVNASRYRLTENMSEGCAEAIGADGIQEAKDRINSIKVGFGGNQLRVTTDAAGAVIGLPKGQELGNFSSFLGFRKRIQLNSKVNWDFPNNTPAVDQNGNPATYPALDAMALQVGAESISSTQFMDLILLHEIGHSFGVDDSATYNKDIWNACKEVFQGP